MGCFKPLRRKVGVATLAIACVFMVIWLGSQGGSRPLLTLYYTRHNKAVVQSFDGHIHFLSKRTNPVGTGYVKVYAVIPCWPIVISSTLVSAFLLLSKVRVKKSAEKRPESI